MHPPEADVARASRACASGPARKRGFNPGAAGIRRLKRLCGLPLPGRLERLIRRLGPDGERPPRVTLLRSYALG